MNNNELFKPLLKLSINVSTQHDDGRVNSIDDEKKVINLMKEAYGPNNVKEPPPRHWYDVLLKGVPVQIKSTEGGTDNFSSKKALLWALTDMSFKEIEDLKGLPWKKFEELLVKRKCLNNNRDYDIICINKSTGKMTYMTLKTLSVLKSNGSNLPFQVPWKENWERGMITRTNSESYDFIVGKYYESVVKKAEQHSLSLIKESLSNNYNSTISR